MPDLPSGIVTFLFTDIEGSTRRWEGQPRAMAAAVARHDLLLRAALAGNGGAVFKTIGDAFCAAFPLASGAVAAAVAGQRALAGESWQEVGGLPVRMALHAGAAEERDGDYFGPPLNRVARLLAAGHGGQVLLSRAAADLARDHLPAGLALRDLGEHRLKDLQHPERIFQLLAPDLAADFPPLRTPDTLRRNLPLHPTALIGREREIATARALLGLAAADAAAPPAGRPAAVTRLLTLTGPGGAGKTRLSLHLAAELAAEFADGAAFVSLAPLSDPELVLPEIAATLEVRDAGGGGLRDHLLDELRSKHLLLVLDNFEQVTAAAPVVADLLAACPRLTILVTSRERLHLRGEQELPLPPLALPGQGTGGRGQGAGDLPPVEELARVEAVALFVERARAVKPNFDLTADNAAAIVEVCRRLDGLPLAIELAAARSRLLPPKALLARLDRRLDLLAGGARDLPDRQQTMRGTIAWSYDLLDPTEQRLFARLAIFVGGCTLAAAERVLSHPEGTRSLVLSEANDSALSTQHSALDVLTSLADKSLVRLDEEGADEPRLSMLEMIRDFGLEQLARNGEAEAIARGHAGWFLGLAEEAEPHLDGPEQTRWLDRLERDHANLRAAFGWLRDHGEAEPALRLGGALWRFWWLRGHIAEGRAQLETLLAGSGEVERAIRAKALNGAGVLAESQGDLEVAAAFHEESLAIARALGDTRGIAWSLNNLGVVALHQGDYERAQTLLAENLAIAERMNDKPSLAVALIDLGQVAHYQGDHERAAALFTQSLVLFRELGSESHVARALNNLGFIALEQGDYERAQTFFQESLELHRAVGDKQGIASTLNNLAEVARCRGDEETAHALYEESRALAVEAGNRLYAAIALENLAALAQRQEESDLARARYGEALLLYRLVGDWLGITACLIGLATIAARNGRAEAAAHLFGAAAALREAHDLPDAAAADGDEAQAVARAALGDGSFEAAWRAGRELPIERVIGEATT